MSIYHLTASKGQRQGPTHLANGALTPPWPLGPSRGSADTHKPGSRVQSASSIVMTIPAVPHTNGQILNLITTQSCSSSKTLNSHVTPTPPGSLTGLKTSPPTHAARPSIPHHHQSPPAFTSFSFHRDHRLLLVNTSHSCASLSFAVQLNPAPIPQYSPGCLLHSYPLGCRALDLTSRT